MRYMCNILLFIDLEARRGLAAIIKRYKFGDKPLEVLIITSLTTKRKRLPIFNQNKSSALLHISF